jgi:hypothetical protein
MAGVLRFNLLHKAVIVSLCCLHVGAFLVRPATPTLEYVNKRRNGVIPYSGSQRTSFGLSVSSQTNMTERFGLNDRFDRWRFLQRLLEAEEKADAVNQILFSVLQGALKYPRPKHQTSDENGSPEMTNDLCSKIEKLLDAGLNGAIPALEDPECTPGSEIVLQKLEDILPDPQEDEDAYKSLWDIVIELHGREMVKINEGNGSPEWKAVCLVARILVHFDFLNYGIVEAPLV